MGTLDKPNAEQAAFGINATNPGLSKREYMAAMFMQAILPYGLREAIPNVFQNCASDAVKAADTLLEALSK